MIHRAASAYQWDNVAFYDFTFRQLKATKPWQSWSKTYVQAWNLAMDDPLGKPSSGGTKDRNNSVGQWQQKKNRDWAR